MDWALIAEGFIEAAMAAVRAARQGTQESEERALLALEATIASGQQVIEECRRRLAANKAEAEKALAEKFPEPETKP